MINEAAQLDLLRLSVISLWEISMLVARRKIELALSPISWFTEAKVKSRIAVEPLSPQIAMEAGDLPGGFRSDPADLIIIATARVTGATLVTHDRRILDYAAAGHVNALAA
jgi:PIN domain nuclease of toxin-antitoxin system